MKLVESIGKKLDKNLVQLFLLFLVLLFNNILWLRGQSGPPVGDHSIHLANSVGFRQLTLWESINTSCAYYTPLVYIVAKYFYALFPHLTFSAELSLSVFLFILIFCTYGLARKLWGEETGHICALVTATSPGILFASRRFYLEVPLAAMLVLCVYLYYHTDDFRNCGMSFLLGTALGLTFETKLHAFFFLAGPFFLILLKVPYKIITGLEGRAQKILPSFFTIVLVLGAAFSLFKFVDCIRMLPAVGRHSILLLLALVILGSLILNVSCEKNEKFRRLVAFIPAINLIMALCLIEIIIFPALVGEVGLRIKLSLYKFIPGLMTPEYSLQKVSNRAALQYDCPYYLLSLKYLLLFPILYWFALAGLVISLFKKKYFLRNHILIILVLVSYGVLTAFYFFTADFSSKLVIPLIPFLCLLGTFWIRYLVNAKSYVYLFLCYMCFLQVFGWIPLLPPADSSQPNSSYFSRESGIFIPFALKPVPGDQQKGKNFDILWYQIARRGASRSMQLLFSPSKALDLIADVPDRRSWNFKAMARDLNAKRGKGGTVWVIPYGRTEAISLMNILKYHASSLKLDMEFDTSDTEAYKAARLLKHRLLLMDREWLKTPAGHEEPLKILSRYQFPSDIVFYLCSTD